MSSLTVAYGHRRLHVPVSPGTPLAEVRDKACEQFGLVASQYGLRRQGKQLDLAVPYRLANLVANATVEVVQSASTLQPVRLKVRQDRGGHDFVGTFAPTTTISQVITAAGGSDTSELKLGDRALDRSATLQSAGLSGAVLLVLSNVSPPKATSTTTTTASQPKAGSAPLPNSHSSVPDTKAVRNQQTNPRPQNLSDHNERHARVVSPQAPSPSIDQQDDSDNPSMTASQFMTYYKHLKTQGEPPLLTRATRERLKEEKRKGITSTTVRVRLPDQHQLEAVFGAEEIGESVYSFVTSHLRHPECQYELVSVSPSQVLAPEENLISDCQFGGRVMLVLRWTGSFPPAASELVLSDKALASLRSPPKTTKAPEETPKAPVSKPVAEEIKPKAKGVPKWLKLQK